MGFEAMRCHADGHTDDGCLGQRRVHDAAVAVLVQQPLGHAEDAAVHTHVLAEHDDRNLLLHGFH
jgi:hypothetical protein